MYTSVPDKVTLHVLLPCSFPSGETAIITVNNTVSHFKQGK